MKWARYEYAGQVGLGVTDGNDIWPAPELDSVLADGLEAAGRDALDRDQRVPVDVVRLLPPLEPASIRDFMVFEQHVMGVSMLANPGPVVPDVWYRQPLFYFTNPAAVVGANDDVPIPPGSRAFDFELEVAAIIRRGGRDLTVAEAHDAILGYTIVNDWSARDLQFEEMQGPLGPCKGKDGSLTLGPWLVTADELEPHAKGSGFDLVMEVWIGDELIGGDRLSSMSWSFAEMISYASRGADVRPGDVFGSGTCGNGCLAEQWGRHGRDSHRPLQAGDIVRMRVEGLGEIANRVVDGPEIREALTPRTPAQPS